MDRLTRKSVPTQDGESGLYNQRVRDKKPRVKKTMDTRGLIRKMGVYFEGREKIRSLDIDNTG